jgi:hypothetical protein
MVKLSRFTPWFSRLVLLAATLVLAMIGRKFILDPVGAAAASNMTLGSALAITNMRASFGAFPLGSAIFALLCAVSERRRLTGLYFVGTIIGTALIVRVFGILTDGTLSDSLRVLIAEGTLLTLSIAAIFAELTARMSVRESPRVPATI